MKAAILRFRLTDEATLAQPPNRLHPAENFLDPFPFALADPVVFSAGRASVDAGEFPTVDASDVRTDRVLAQIIDKVFDVRALVGALGLGMKAATTGAGEQRTGGLVFGLRRIRDQDIDIQTTAIHTARTRETSCQIGATI